VDAVMLFTALLLDRHFGYLTCKGRI